MVCDASHALPDAELLCALQWLDVPALVAAGCVCRRWRGVALWPSAWAAHRPRSPVWERTELRAAVAAQHVAERGWRTGRCTRRDFAAPRPDVVVMMKLDGPRLAVVCFGAVDVLDTRTLEHLYAFEMPGLRIGNVAFERERLAVCGDRGRSPDSTELFAGVGGSVRAIGVHLPRSSTRMAWRGAQLAVGTAGVRDHTMHRVDVASGRVARSVVLWEHRGAMPGFRNAAVDAFPCADGAGMGLVTRSGLHLDDGRSERAVLLPMRHSERCSGSHWRTYAHPDGRTLATFCYDPLAELVGEADTGVTQLWDMRALAHAYATVDHLTCEDGFLSFGRATVRIGNAACVRDHDLYTGATLGEPYALDDRYYSFVTCANEAFVVSEWHDLDLRIDGTRSDHRTCTLYEFDTAASSSR